MNSTLPNTTPVLNRSNIQGLILRGYTHPLSTHFMFKFNDAKGVPAFIKNLLPYIQNAENWNILPPFTKPGYMLNIAFTWNGITIIHPGYAANAFTQPFTNGPTSYNSQLNLNDTGPSAPAGWWGTNFNNADVHCVVHAYAMTSGDMDTISGLVADAVTAGGASMKELFPMKGQPSAGKTDGRLRQSQLPPNYIQFGYRDGIDEPDLSPAVPEQDPSYLSYFLIGYDANPPGPNTNYGAPPAPSPNYPTEYAFAKDGCYNAFRILSQDVVGFENFLTEQAQLNAASIPAQPNNQFPTQEAYAREWLAAKLNGRWRDGTPLTMSPTHEDPGQVENTTFMYNNQAINEPDMKGLKCPFSAHTRVGNPRDEGVIALDAPVPRISRRGVPYGSPYNPEQPGTEDARGLIGMFLCGDLATQFEKLYAWINFNNFSDVFPGGAGALSFTQDALIANRTQAKGTPRINPSFTIPLESGGTIKIPKLPQLVTTVGTAYCLLPPISSLQDIADGKIG